MNRKIAAFDIIFYGALPYLIWTYGRDPMGDYYAMLLSTVPGFIYTIYRFVKEKQINFLGLFIIVSLLISTLVNVLSGNAEDMLWNQVYIGYVTASVFLISILVKRPLALYFAIDMASLQGYKRSDSKWLFTRKGLFMWFQLFTGLFVFRSLFQSGLKAWLIEQYGVDGYGKMIIYMQVSGWIFSGLILGMMVLLSYKINQHLKTNVFKSSTTSSTTNQEGER
ncbi:hypothetical protein CEY16_12945 [Halalkalibacillus sediminis]|uniref:DUF3159 domain-containing protein n=1 Tax=Halalkalibacillus sediminis TaxID=2018042 RepID=A0A2I0QRL9_9BACI|nr:VC0807 family protein [Halalkalibacillus sediminis]PKR76720.1 hypothetical protein CEY16_12945 [Halalkalibacillus sediminis]